MTRKRREPRKSPWMTSDRVIGGDNSTERIGPQKFGQSLKADFRRQWRGAQENKDCEFTDLHDVRQSRLQEFPVVVRCILTVTLRWLEAYPVRHTRHAERIQSGAVGFVQLVK